MEGATGHGQVTYSCAVCVGRFCVLALLMLCLYRYRPKEKEIGVRNVEIWLRIHWNWSVDVNSHQIWEPQNEALQSFPFLEFRPASARGCREPEALEHFSGVSGTKIRKFPKFWHLAGKSRLGPETGGFHQIRGRGPGSLKQFRKTGPENRRARSAPNEYAFVNFSQGPLAP